MSKELMKLALEALDGGHVDRAYGYIQEALAQPQREWIGLTDEKILKSEWAIGANDVLLNFARTIEAKLKEKNT